MLEQEYYDDEYCELKLEQGITIFARNKNLLFMRFVLMILKIMF